eukprot:1917075-Rhodomonas_salina.2
MIVAKTTAPNPNWLGVRRYRGKLRHDRCEDHGSSQFEEGDINALIDILSHKVPEANRRKHSRDEVDRRRIDRPDVEHLAQTRAAAGRQYQACADGRAVWWRETRRIRENVQSPKREAESLHTLLTLTPVI